MQPAYIFHVGLRDGRTHRSFRAAVHDPLMGQIAELIGSACNGPGVRLPSSISGACRLQIEDYGPCALAFVTLLDGSPLLTLGIAGHARCGARLWRVLHEGANTLPKTRVDSRPSEPWCARRHEIGAFCDSAPFPPMHLLTDLEDCLAWAWIERQNVGNATARAGAHSGERSDRGLA